MPQGAAKAEAVRAEEEQASLEGDFDSAAALDAEGFPEFLAEFEDAEEFDPNDEAALKTRFEAFKNKENVADGMTGFIEKHIGSKGLAEAFDDPQIADMVHARIVEMAHEDPEKVNSIHESLAELATATEAIADIEERLSRCGAKKDLDEYLAGLEEKEKALADAKEVSGFFSRKLIGLAAWYEKLAFGREVRENAQWLKEKEGQKDWALREDLERFNEEKTEAQRLNAARLKVRDEYQIDINPDAIELELLRTREDLRELREHIQTRDALEAARLDTVEQLGFLRSTLVRGLGLNEALRDAAQAKVAQKLDQLMESDPEEALRFFEKAREASGDDELGIDYLGDNADFWGEEIQRRIELAVNEDIRAAVFSIKLGDKTFQRLMDSLEPFMEKLGAKGEREARAFVVDALKAIMKERGAQDKASAIVLKFAIAKITRT